MTERHHKHPWWLVHCLSTAGLSFATAVLLPAHCNKRNRQQDAFSTKQTSEQVDTLFAPVTSTVTRWPCDTFTVISHNNSYYTVQNHSRSPILAATKSAYTTSYYWIIILTCILSCTASKLLRIISPIFACDRGRYLYLTHYFGGETINSRLGNLLSRN